MPALRKYPHELRTRGVRLGFESEAVHRVGEVVRERLVAGVPRLGAP
jgi:hypothetical protein